MGFSDWLQASQGTISFIGVCLAVVFGSLTILFYLKSRRIKQPVYAIRSAHLIQNVSERVNRLEVKYAGEIIPNLTSAKIFFWNQGRETIQGSDVAQADPLRIRVAAGLKILEAKVLGSVNSANRCDVSNDTSAASLTFDFLDYGEGAVIQVLHTGSHPSDLSVTGTIKGAGKVRERSIRLFRTRPPRLTRWMASTTGITICFLVPFFTLAAALVLSHQKHAIGPKLSIFYSWGAIVFIFIGYWGIGFINLWQRVPPGFQLFFEEE